MERQNWVELLDSFCESTGVYVEVVNLEGERLIKNRKYQISGFCKKIQELDGGDFNCKESYKRACVECGKWLEPYYFRCHTGLVMWALPLSLNNKQVGAIICGQVLLWKADSVFYRELKEFKKDIEYTEELKKEVDDLRVISSATCKSLSDLLYVFTNYLLKAYDKNFIEDKEIMEWRQQVITELKQRKDKYQDYKFDNSVYIQREKKLLQHIRTGSKEKVIKLMPIIFTDIEILSNYDYKIIKQYCLELMTLISRAAVDGGIDTNIALDILRKFKRNTYKYKIAEELFNNLNSTILTLLDMIYILGDGNQNTILRNARDYIENNYYNKITIDDICESIYVSKYYLCHLFKENLNLTINDYIVRFRIEKSIELMKKKELDINSIMIKVGFSSQSHFTRTFKKIMGVTPGSYKKRFL